MLTPQRSLCNQWVCCKKLQWKKTSYSTKMKVFVLKSAQLWVGSYHVMSTTVHCCWPPPHKQECKALKCWALCSSSDLPNICIRCFCQVLYQVARNRHSRSTADVICQCVSGGGEREGNEITPGGQRFGGSDWSSSRLQNSQWSWTGKEKDVSMHVKSFFRGKLKKDCVFAWPAVHSCQGGVTEGEEFGVDDREHGLAASVTVTEGELQQIPQALWEGDGRQQAEL